MATVADIITDALEITGIKSPHDPLDSTWTAIGLRRLNSIIDGWNATKLSGYGITEIDDNLVADKSNYTIGSTGDINVTERPVKIYNCYIIDSSGVKHQVEQIDFVNFHKEDYLESANSYPIVFWYNPQFELGEINFYPTPSGNFDVHFDVMFGFYMFDDVGDTVYLPQGYKKYLTYQLAVEICPHVGMEPPRHVFRVYKQLENTIESTNFDTTMLYPDIDGFTINNVITMDRGI